MKILITGTDGLAKSLAECYQSHQVDCVSRSTGHDIKNIDTWGHVFLGYDIVFNCAYEYHGQVAVLEFFYKNWKNDPTKTIVSVGSRIISYPGLDNNNDYFPYKISKISLQLTHDQMLINADCRLLIVNPGPFDTAMVAHHDCVKFSPDQLAKKIVWFVEDSSIKRVDLWL